MITPLAPPSPTAAARQEAGEWFARLRTQSIAAETLEKFETWRSEPVNDAAYREIEGVWRAGDGLDQSPPMRAAIAEAMVPARRRPKSRAPKFALPILSGLAFTGALAAAAFVYVDPPLGGVEYQTRVGETKTVALADGSSVRLDTNSRLVARLGSHARDLWLSRGQAFFSVAHDRSRPFVVRAAETRVRAVGTQFDVRRGANGVDVALIEGAVLVSQRRWTGSASEPLTAGQALHADASGVRVLFSGNVADRTAWIGGHMVFHDAPLNSVLEEMNRYSAVRLRLDGSSGLAGLRVSGIFNTGDTKALLTALKDLYGLEGLVGGDGEIVVGPAKTS